MKPTAIRQALDARGWSQSFVGDLLGVRQSAVSKRLRGESIWPAVDVKRLAEALGCTADDLLSDSLPGPVVERLALERANEAVSA
jgi:transcriptional regulator with XRE-family HTH domain